MALEEKAKGLWGELKKAIRIRARRNAKAGKIARAAHQSLSTDLVLCNSLIFG